jgi:fatty acid/phospholipid synthesis protein PlsX
MPKDICLAVDAMGGDFGPEINVPGSLAAARETGARIILVGDETSIRKELDRHPHADVNVEIVHTTQVAGMAEKPSDILRRKKDSSMQVAFRLVREGRAHGVITAGNSGAALACGMFILGRIHGVDRPALASIMPTLKKPIVLIDVGANADCKPYNLVQFGLMAEVLARHVLDIDNPKVGILSIGEEEGKGNSLTKEAYALLKSSSLNFVGNVEGRDVFTGETDVIVCDGFTGNVALKLSDGTEEIHLVPSGDTHRLARLQALRQEDRLRRIRRSAHPGTQRHRHRLSRQVQRPRHHHGTATGSALRSEKSQRPTRRRTARQHGIEPLLPERPVLRHQAGSFGPLAPAQGGASQGNVGILTCLHRASFPAWAFICHEPS